MKIKFTCSEIQPTLRNVCITMQSLVILRDGLELMNIGEITPTDDLIYTTPPFFEVFPYGPPVSILEEMGRSYREGIHTPFLPETHYLRYLNQTLLGRQLKNDVKLVSITPGSIEGEIEDILEWLGKIFKDIVSSIDTSKSIQTNLILRKKLLSNNGPSPTTRNVGLGAVIVAHQGLMKYPNLKIKVID